MGSIEINGVDISDEARSFREQAAMLQGYGNELNYALDLLIDRLHNPAIKDVSQETDYANSYIERLKGQPVVIPNYRAPEYYLATQEGSNSLLRSQSFPHGFERPTVMGLLRDIRRSQVRDGDKIVVLGIDPLERTNDPEVKAFYEKRSLSANRVAQPFGLRQDQHVRVWLPVSELEPAVQIDTGYLRDAERTAEAFRGALRYGRSRGHFPAPETDDETVSTE